MKGCSNFLVPLVINNGTGEPGRITLFYNLYLYKTFFTFQQMGYGIGHGLAVVCVILMLTLVHFQVVAPLGLLRGRPIADGTHSTERTATRCLVGIVGGPDTGQSSPGVLATFAGGGDGGGFSLTVVQAALTAVKRRTRSTANYLYCRRIDDLRA